MTAERATERPHLTVLEGSRGRPDMVSQRMTEAMAPILEGQAIAADAIAACERIAVALNSGAVTAAYHEAGRLSGRAIAARDELRRMAADLEPRPVALA